MFQGQKHPELSPNDDAMSQIQRKALLKMYPTWIKVEAKKFTQLREKFGKNFLGKLKHTCVDETENPSKKVALSFRQWETTSMPPPKARTLKHIEVLELNNDDDFSSKPD